MREILNSSRTPVDSDSTPCCMQFNVKHENHLRRVRYVSWYASRTSHASLHKIILTRCQI